MHDKQAQFMLRFVIPFERVLNLFFVHCLVLSSVHYILGKVRAKINSGKK